MYRGTYTLIGAELSMFTRKMEAQLRYQNIPYEWKYKSMGDASELEKRAGTRFVPLLETPDGWLINESINRFSWEALPHWSPVFLKRYQLQCFPQCSVPRVVLNPHQPIGVDAKATTHDRRQVFGIVGD